MSKKKPRGFPMVIYVARHEDGETRYYTADKDPEQLVQMDERVTLARYLFADTVVAKGVVKLGRD
jgi:hypothetical protein